MSAKTRGSLKDPVIWIAMGIALMLVLTGRLALSGGSTTTSSS